MSVEGASDLIEALSRGELERVVDTAEDAWIDFKRDPYLTNTSRGVWELVKDVAAFAENRGGFIVIGYATERRSSEGLEIASAVHRVPRQLINSEQYRDLIDRRVYPRVRDLRMKWYPPGDEEDGIFLIEIPPQSEQDKPFILVTMMNENDQEQVHTIGLPRRDGDRVTWEHPETIHHQIHGGRLLPFLGDERSFQQGDRSEEALAALQRTLSLVGEEVPAFLALQALPSSPRRPPSDPLGLELLRRAIVDARPLRQMGFNFQNAGEPRIVAGRSIEVEGRSRALRIEPSGIVTAVFAADRDGLGWALSQHLPEGAPLRVNSIALVELTLEFFRLIHGAIGPVWTESELHVIVWIRGMGSGNVVLEPGLPLKGIPLSAPTHASTAESDQWGSEFDSYGDAEKDAFAALVNFYALWGLGPESIPCAEDGRISSQMVSKL